MDRDKRDYYRGLIYFICLVFSLLMGVKVPDGDILLYKFLALFGIPHGIPTGPNGTFYLFNILLIAAIVIFFKKVFRYWHSYGVRFKNLSFLLRYLPLAVALPVVLVSSPVMSPTGIERMFYAFVTHRGGLQAISSTLNMSGTHYRQNEDILTFYYDLTLENHSDNILTFNVKLTPMGSYYFGDTFIKDENGEVKLFTMFPKTLANFRGEFEDKAPIPDLGVHYGGEIYRVILINENEEYTPKRVIR